jgi:hypothetical protein
VGCAPPLASYRYMSKVRWQRGDVDRLAPLLHFEIELIWWGPGEWDCHGRETGLSMLRGRGKEGARAALIEAGEGAIVAARVETVPDGPAAGLRLATSAGREQTIAVRLNRKGRHLVSAAGKKGSVSGSVATRSNDAASCSSAQTVNKGASGARRSRQACRQHYRTDGQLGRPSEPGAGGGRAVGSQLGQEMGQEAPQSPADPSRSRSRANRLKPCPT